MINKHFQIEAVKIILVTQKINKKPNGGRELLSKVNHDALLSLYGNDLILFELENKRPTSALTYINTFRGHIDGLDTETIQSIISTIQGLGKCKVFVDGSNLGGFIAVLKQRLPAVPVTTFFHNVEVRFFWGGFKANKTIRSFAVMVANYLAERKSVRLSNKIVCLSQRDSQLIKTIYGRPASHIAPMVLEDKFPDSHYLKTTQPPENFALFVGGTFYANRDGIEWFVKNVVPRINLPIYIVGRGFEKFKNHLEIPDKVIVVGAVDSLSDWYIRSKFVIAPIFDGSGMKTKVAEALMYGKKIVGTPEAFSGYEDIAEQAGWICRDVESFLQGINDACATITQSFDLNLRVLYTNNYSLDSAISRLSVILQSDN